jgi:hypothetical protein
MSDLQWTMATDVMTIVVFLFSVFVCGCVLWFVGSSLFALVRYVTRFMWQRRQLPQ